MNMHKYKVWYNLYLRTVYVLGGMDGMGGRAGERKEEEEEVPSFMLVVKLIMKHFIGGRGGKRESVDDEE